MKKFHLIEKLPNYTPIILEPPLRGMTKKIRQKSFHHYKAIHPTLIRFF